MTLNQIGMLLQIAGFIITAVFAGVILEKGVLSIWRGKGEAWFVSLTSVLERVTFSWGKTETGFAMKIPGEQKLSSLRVKTFVGMIVYSILFSSPSVGAGCAITGYIIDLRWLFWVGIGFFILLPIAILIIICSNIRHKNTRDDSEYKMLLKSKPDDELEASLPERKGSPLILLPLILILLILLFILFSWLAIPLCLFLGVLRASQLLVLFLQGKDALKKALLITGTSILLVGLILEFVATL